MSYNNQRSIVQGLRDNVIKLRTFDRDAFAYL